MDEANSVAFFKTHWLCWKILGIAKEAIKFKGPYLLYGILLNLLVTVGYPLHLMMALFQNETQADNFKNLAVCVTCIACSAKFLIYATKLEKVHQVESILEQLDARVHSADERHYFRKIRRNVRNIAYVFLSVYLPVGVTAELSFIFKEERGLLYPAWFPFNWRDSNVNYMIANVYQIVGISYQLMQNYVDDCFPPMALCLLSGHIKLLGIRVAKIGYGNSEDVRENELELRRCITDQKNLYKLFDTIHEIMSMPMFIQFCVTACNICVAMAALIFYVDAPLDRLYYFVYFLAMPLQIFPTCYYGSDFQLLFGQLHYAVFSSNWISQSRNYKKLMILFTERSLKQTTAIAGGMLRIHLDTFFSTCKAAYSLFAVIMRLKN